MNAISTTKGQVTVVNQAPIKVSVKLQENKVEQIMIQVTGLQTPLYDDVFMALEDSLKCSSINFYNAYKKAISTHITQVGQAHGIQAVHQVNNDQLTVTMTRK
ncbi:hypothetical protein [Oenococcus oeni]|uniref:hypothetical protein n=1 Tax=Oenococcus oeni TaxID=1247 RepID=UPI001646A289|nr:hypothetical protein [Oenococcus oeni]